MQEIVDREKMAVMNDRHKSMYFNFNTTKLHFTVHSVTQTLHARI